MEELIGQPYRILRARLDARDVSVRELVDSYLARIDRLAHLGGYVVVDMDGARRTADELDRELAAGIRRGPLHGIPLGMKDSIAVAGLPTRAGSGVYEGFIPAVDAAVVRDARSAGGVVLGKQSMHELGIGDPVREGELRTGVHPRNPAFVAGGSSSGSAIATAAGLCALAVAEDSGGSIRNPAASCGVVGFKPTYGRMPVAGLLPLCWSLDTIGLMAREVELIQAAFTVLGNAAPLPPPDRDPRLAVFPPGSLGSMADEIVSALDRCRDELTEAGATFTTTAPADLEMARSAWLARLSEAYAVHAANLVRAPEGFSPTLRTILQRGATVTRDEYAASWLDQARLTRDIDAALDGSDALLLPANPHSRMRWEEWKGLNVFDWYRFCWPFNVTGHPAVTLPFIIGEERIPIAYQLVGRGGEDERLLEVARWCFERLPFQALVDPDAETASI